MAGAKSGSSSFAKHLATGRWTSVFASFLIMAGAGGSYLFPVFSSDIKKNLGYNQSALNTLSSFKDIGSTVGILSGLIAEVTPTWFVLLTGSVTNFFGYFMIWLAVTGRIPQPPLWQMCLYIFLGANSQNFANTGALVTCVKNFPESRSIMLGLLKGYVGLSAAILNQLYLAIYGDDSSSLILFIAWLPAVISILVMYVIREKEVKISQPNEVNVFYKFLYVSAALAVFLMSMTLVQQRVTFSPTGYDLSATAACILVFLPSVVAFKQELLLWRKITTAPAEIVVENAQAVEQKQKSSADEAEEPKKSFFAHICNKPKRGEDYSILQAVLSIDMLIIFIVTLVGLGSCLAALDNLGQIGEALLYEHKTVWTFASLGSIWSYAGRIFAGFASEILLKKYKFPRPLMLSAILFVECIGHLLVAFPFYGSIYLSSLIVGFTSGAQLPLVFAIISEIFGLKHFSTLFNCGVMALPIGSFLLNKELTGRLYDKEAKRQSTVINGLNQPLGQALVCKGKQCFGLSFTIMALATLFGALISLILVGRTWSFYVNEVSRGGETYEKFSDEEKEEETRD